MGIIWNARKFSTLLQGHVLLGFLVTVAEIQQSEDNTKLWLLTGAVVGGTLFIFFVIAIVVVIRAKRRYALFSVCSCFYCWSPEYVNGLEMIPILVVCYQMLTDSRRLGFAIYSFKFSLAKFWKEAFQWSIDEAPGGRTLVFLLRVASFRLVNVYCCFTSPQRFLGYC